jgi:DNA-binding MarR family transcriptional regulator
MKALLKLESAVAPALAARVSLRPMRKTAAPPAPPLLDLDQYTPGLLVWVSNKLSASASALYRRLFDLGVTDWRVLCYIQIYPWSTGAQVCELIGLDKAAVSRSFAMLGERGLLQSRPSGLRKVEYATTEHGQRVYEEVLEVALQREQALLQGFTADEKSALIGYMHRLLENLPAVDAVGGRYGG